MGWNASWAPSRGSNGMLRLPALPRLPGTRCDDDEDAPEEGRRPLWQAVLLSLVEGLAAGAAPTLVTYALHKMDPGVFGAEDGETDDEASE